MRQKVDAFEFQLKRLFMYLTGEVRTRFFRMVFATYVLLVSLSVSLLLLCSLALLLSCSHSLSPSSSHTLSQTLFQCISHSHSLSLPLYPSLIDSLSLTLPISLSLPLFHPPSQLIKSSSHISSFLQTNGKLWKLILKTFFLERFKKNSSFCAFFKLKDTKRNLEMGCEYFEIRIKLVFTEKMPLSRSHRQPDSPISFGQFYETKLSS